MISTKISRYSVQSEAVALSALAGVAVAGAAMGWWLLKRFIRRLSASMARDAISIISTDEYDENVWEFISAGTRYGFQEIVETNLRATKGKTILRPLGSPRKYPNFDGLVFDISQIAQLPVELGIPIDLQLIIGPRCRRPLVCQIPIVIAGMAYGEALSEKVKIAIARGASIAGTATNTGEGPWLPKEREEAKLLIMELNRGMWNRSEDIYRQADAIEIQMGQGALAGAGHSMSPNAINAKLRKQFGVTKGEPAVVESRQPGVNSPEDFERLVVELRATTDGVPIGVKLAAGMHIEDDMEIALRAGVDFISIDGAEAATKGAPPILSDDFGLPTIIALSRAVRYLESTGKRDEVTLLIGGRINNPGRVLKAIALGADGVYMGAAVLYAVSHEQVSKSIPLEPPTQVTWYDGKQKNLFNIDEGAKYLANFLISCKSELATALRSLGKTSLRQVSRQELTAVDRTVSEITGVPLAWEPR